MKLRLIVAFVLLASSAAADDTTGARTAYDRGLAAANRGDHSAAAGAFAEADARAPSDVALEAALDQAVLADDVVLGGELLERSTRTTPTGDLAASVEAAQKRLAGRAGRVLLICSALRCLATLDAKPLEGATPVWTSVGTHRVEIRFDGTTETRLVRVEAGALVEVRAGGAPPKVERTSESSPRAPTTVAPVPTRARKPLPPVVFFAGAAATVLLGGGIAYFGVDARNQHDIFVRDGCATATTSDCRDRGERGERAQRTANALIIATGSAAVLTGLVAAFFTDWDRPFLSLVASPVPRGGYGSLSGTF